MSDFIPMELDSYVDPVDPVEELQEDIIDDIIEDSIDEPSDIEPEPIADYSEGDIIDAEDIQEEPIASLNMEETEIQIAEEPSDEIVANPIEEEIDEIISDTEIIEETAVDNEVIEEETDVLDDEITVDSFERYSRVGTRETPYGYSNGGEVVKDEIDRFVPTLLR